MKRDDFRKLFKSVGPAVLPVIHVTDTDQATRNVRVLVEEGAPGCFLINHDFGVERFLPIIAHVRARFPALWMGVNFLAVTGRDAFPVLGKLAAEGVAVDGYWADDARIDERRSGDDQVEAQEIDAALAASGWDGLYTGGTCFKKQREVAPEHYEYSARLATGFMDAVCTSGVATGKAVDLSKIETFRRAIGDEAMTLASGITPENAHLYMADVDGFMVATGINRDGDFYNIEPAKLARLLKLTRTYGAQS
ncbi:adenine phosphoribosyltransferase [Aestuariivirga litoralis]|uniref:Adenine phosphoribosyltransferase n=1 Tax=Aestuariivirga litoralis TaxID=2650924 RepID=A0A2W2BRX7_9HYPH|nr:BtpA/SgcQ family protein [Aestuariivirga litoralis]PZF78949.1 adenine phosphoribosyltransferase [Aestuariivirga litoralis]